MIKILRKIPLDKRLLIKFFLMELCPQLRGVKLYIEIIEAYSYLRHGNIIYNEKKGTKIRFSRDYLDTPYFFRDFIYKPITTKIPR